MAEVIGKMYGYHSPWWLLTIRPLPEHSGMWCLCFDNGVVGPTDRIRTWSSPSGVADAVREQRTGFEPWDSLTPAVLYPATLDDWVELPGYE